MKNVTTEELRDLLVPTHIHYDIGSQPLKARAFAEIITKILSVEPERKLAFRDISHGVSEFIDAKDISPQDLSLGIKFLEEQGVVTKQGKKYVLSNKAYKEIEKNLDISRRRVDRILEDYFPAHLEKSNLRRWFLKASSDLIKSSTKKSS